MSRVGTAFSAFDGRVVAPLRDLAAEVSERERGEVLAAIAGPDQVAATWVVKHWADKGRLTADEAGFVFSALDRITAADAVLHVLQMVQHFPAEARAALPRFRVHLAHKRVLVRVWSLDAVARCADRAEARALVEQALSDVSAAMRARGRALQRDLFGDDG